MSEHRINENVTLITDESGELTPEHLEVRVGKDLYDWGNAPNDARLEVVGSGIVQELEDIKEAERTPKVVEAEYEEVESDISVLPPAQGIGGIVRPAVSAREALAAWKEFQALKKMILEKSDLQRIGNKDFIKKSGWRKFATFYNLTDRITEETQVKSGSGYYWKIKVVCIAPNGRTVEGVGICSSTERKFSHPEHDIYATAHTRAKNRATSDMIAAGEVSAEEVQSSF